MNHESHRHQTVSLAFGALEADQADPRTAATVIVPLPYDGTTTYRTGTRMGPAAIIEASGALELFDEDLHFSPADSGIATLAPLEQNAQGPEATIMAIRDYCLGPVQDGKFVVALGGEHSVTIGAVQAQREADPTPFGVLQIDAHADLRQSYQGSPFSHACVMRRLVESHPIVQVGIRSFSEPEYRFMEQEGLAPWTMSRIRRTEDWIERVVSELPQRVYLTIDLDGLDPSICPGVGTPEPGGLGWAETLDLMRVLFSERQVIGADVVECLPLPGQTVSEFLAARLIYKLIALRNAP